MRAEPVVVMSCEIMTADEAAEHLQVLARLGLPARHPGRVIRAQGRTDMAVLEREAIDEFMREGVVRRLVRHADACQRLEPAEVAT